MSDREFLIWLHERLTLVHHERSTMDYMHKLRAIIAATPPNRATPNTGLANNLAELMEHLQGEETK